MLLVRGQNTGIKSNNFAFLMMLKKLSLIVLLFLFANLILFFFKQNKLCYK